VELLSLNPFPASFLLAYAWCAQWWWAWAHCVRSCISSAKPSLERTNL